MITETELDGRARWLDLVSPTANEEAEVESALGIDVPTQEDIRKNEPSSKLYREDGATFMAARIIVHGETPLPQTSNVAFILKNDTLVTVRYEQSRAFDLCASENSACRQQTHGHKRLDRSDRGSGGPHVRVAGRCGECRRRHGVVLPSRG